MLISLNWLSPVRSRYACCSGYLLLGNKWSQDLEVKTNDIFFYRGSAIWARLRGNIIFAPLSIRGDGSEAGAGIIWRLTCSYVGVWCWLPAGTSSEMEAGTPTHGLSMELLGFLRIWWLGCVHPERTGHKLYMYIFYNVPLDVRALFLQ